MKQGVTFIRNKKEQSQPEPDEILNETIFAEKPLEEKREEFATPAQEKREQSKKYKKFLSSIEDIKKISYFGASLLLKVNGRIPDRRFHLQQGEALSIVEPTYRLFDRNVLVPLSDMLPEVGDENVKDIKEIVTALLSWGMRCLMVFMLSWSSSQEEKAVKSQLNTLNMKEEIRRRQAQAHKEFEEKEEAPKEAEYFGGFASKDDSLNMISIDPNQLDPEMIGAFNDGVAGV